MASSLQPLPCLVVPLPACSTQGRTQGEQAAPLSMQSVLHVCTACMPSCSNPGLQHLCDSASLLNLLLWWFEANIAVKDTHGSVAQAA